jgi:2-octaprenyl-6-methoxyphenol hydroxylase
VDELIKYDVLIIGGAMVGGSLALGLQHSGLRVAIIDATMPEERLASAAGERAIALSQGSAQLLDRLGLWSAISAHAAAIKDIHISDRGHFGKARLSAKKEGVKALGYVATAHTIEMAIHRQLKKAGIKLFCPAELVAIDAGENGAEITISTSGKKQKLHCQLVVGADGGQSTVRQLNQIEQEVREYHQTVVSVVVRPGIDGKQVAYERFTSSGPLAFLPIEGGLYSVVWTMADEAVEAIMALPDEQFLQQLQEAFGYKLGQLELAGGRGAFPLCLVRAKKMVAPRALLIGNASHQIHPVGGQGFNLGLRDAAQLAELILDASERGIDLGDPALLKRYSDLREKDHKAVIESTDGLVRLFSSDFLPLALARNIGLLAMDHLPPVKSGISRFAMGLSGRMPRLHVKQRAQS